LRRYIVEKKEEGAAEKSGEGDADGDGDVDGRGLHSSTFQLNLSCV
jgi:hypothetical protein